MPETTITREAAAKRLGCSMRTVERMLRDGRLQPIRQPDGRLAVDRADLELVLREPKLLKTRAEPSVVTTAANVDPDLPTRTAEPEPSRSKPSMAHEVAWFALHACWQALFEPPCSHASRH